MSLPGNPTLIVATVIGAVMLILVAIWLYALRLFIGDAYDQAVARDAEIARKAARRSHIARFTRVLRRHPADPAVADHNDPNGEAPTT